MGNFDGYKSIYGAFAAVPFFPVVAQSIVDAGIGRRGFDLVPFLLARRSVPPQSGCARPL